MEKMVLYLGTPTRYLSTSCPDWFLLCLWMRVCVISAHRLSTILFLSPTLFRIHDGRLLLGHSSCGLAMVYLLWTSDGCSYLECDIGAGSWFLIVAQVFWMIAGFFTKSMRPNAFQRKKKMMEEEAKKQQEGKRVVRFNSTTTARPKRASMLARISQEERTKKINMELIPFFCEYSDNDSTDLSGTPSMKGKRERKRDTSK
ncbi:unnamed protein product [Cylindrotheca closterium]|uniref:Uncharacterized protein n=1 Tax=Cylindrotheca closterium TaxID=2856 RepID=A0AAD2GAF7_9STRA|nr:unnamed protein product [Cylindrotheca closterium]